MVVDLATENIDCAALTKEAGTRDFWMLVRRSVRQFEWFQRSFFSAGRPLIVRDPATGEEVEITFDYSDAGVQESRTVKLAPGELAAWDTELETVVRAELDAAVEDSPKPAGAYSPAEDEFPATVAPASDVAPPDSPESESDKPV